MPKHMFNEDLLHYVWRFTKFNQHDLQTTKSQTIQILHPGQHNHHAGPDFLDAKIKIDDTIWHGHVEIHKKSSNWIEHNHQKDPSYENVILHVVYKHDREIKYANGKAIPTFSLHDRIDDKIFSTYQDIMFNALWVPCAKYVQNVPDIKKTMWLGRLSGERLSEKSHRILNILEENKQDWDATTYRLIAQYLGQKTNGDAFLRLLESIPFEILLKYRDNVFKLEAILFGQSGLLKIEDDYTQKLFSEYDFMQKKHKLSRMNAVEWKFAKMRPFSFPTLRIAQLAVLIHKKGRIFQIIKDDPTPERVESLLDINCTEYWDTHYRFGAESATKKKVLGRTAKDIIIINVIAPILFAYGTKTGDQTLKDKAIQLLESLKAEKIGIISKWKDHGIQAKNASDSQALLHLKTKYCDKFRCLNCAIGAHIFST